MCQKLKSEDYDRRMEYQELILGWPEDWSKFFEKNPGVTSLLVTLGFLFHVGCFINRPNWHYLVSCDNDPNMMVEIVQARTKVTV